MTEESRAARSSGSASLLARIDPEGTLDNEAQTGAVVYQVSYLEAALIALQARGLLCVPGEPTYKPGDWVVVDYHYFDRDMRDRAGVVLGYPTERTIKVSWGPRDRDWVVFDLEQYRTRLRAATAEEIAQARGERT